MAKEIQLRYEPALPDAFPMPKREYLYPVFNAETWETLVKSYIESLEVLREQAVKEAENPKMREPPWMRKNPDTGLFEHVYE